MSYAPTIWKTGDIITAQKLNKMENAIHTILSDYSQTNWVDGEIITAEKLNKLEDAIEYVNLEYVKTVWGNNDIITAALLNKMETGIEEASIDKTWNEMNWNDIIVATRTGKYENFQIHDAKELDLGTEGILDMEIVGIDEDDLADGTGKAALAFMSLELLQTSHRMSPANDNNAEGTGAIGGWEKSEIRAWLREQILPLFPENVRKEIKVVVKYSTSYDTSGTKVTNAETSDTIWIPSEREMNGVLTNTETMGPIYSDAFPNDASRTKNKVGASPAGWWLRTAGSTTQYKDVSAAGVLNNSNSSANQVQGVAIGFCL